MAATGATTTTTTTTTTERIHVGGLGLSVSIDDLRKLFSAVGTVEGLDIVRTKGRSFSYVDILPSSSNSLSKLFSTYNGCVWKGGKLKLEKAKEHYLTRMKREWAEAKEAEGEAESEEEDDEAIPSSSVNLSKNNKVQVSQNGHIRIFFPRLSKVKSLPLSGTGKHRYSFQRVETHALPIHFCDCEEHSGRFNTVKQKQVEQHQEEVNGGMNEEEISMMNLVMNKLFERENISNTSKAVLGMERDNFLKPIEDAPSHEEEEEDDDDDLIINFVSNANKGAAMSGSTEQQAISSKKRRLGETQISNDGEIQSVHKVQKKNAFHPKKKRKLLSNQEEDIDEGVSVSDGKKRNSEFDEREADFEENEADDDNIIINAVSAVNKRMALSGSTKHAKASSKQKFKSCEIQTCEGKSTQNEHNVQKKDPLLPDNSMISFCAEERNGNEVASNVNVEKGNSQSQQNGFVVAQPTEAECGLKQSSSSRSWSQKSSWKALVGDSSNNAFNLSNILQNVDAATEKQQISDVPKVDSTLDSRSEELATPDNSEGMLGKTEIVDVVAKAQPNQHNSASNNSGRGSSWLHKSSWVQLISDKSSSFSISEILPIGSSTNQEHAKTIREDVTYNADGNQSNITKLQNSEPKVNSSTALKERNGDILQSIPESGQKNVGSDKDVSAPIVEKICNSEPNKGFGGDNQIGETCSFMRSSASLKEWVKTKAALKGSRKKKRE